MMDALNAWLVAARIDSGSVFRAIDRWGNVSKRAIDPKAINDIVKQRLSRHRSVQEASSYTIVPCGEAGGRLECSS